ncbi:MAG TPA: hypothetical protein VJ650_00045 [Gemmatimonadaceae bacterium]|nr:hypothetical protein [Gemmatimonadaceae bacterium]
MRSRALLPFFAAATLLVACDDRPTGPGNEAADDAALRSVNTQSFGPLVLPATGVLADGGSFVGEVEIRRIDVDHTTGVFTIRGLLQGKATTADGKMKQIRQEFSTPTTISSGVAAALGVQDVQLQQTIACDVLNLDLGPLHLDLLGLVVDLAPVVLDITAVPGPGNLLGNLLCAIVSLLDFPGLLGVVGQILDAVNQILGGLGG